MARPLWSGTISFGLVNVPVRMHSAVKDRNVRFHLMSPDGSCRLRRKLYCPETGREYDFSETSRGFEIAPDQYVLVDDEELEQLQPEQGRAIEIEDFVRLDEIDPVYFDRPYCLTPDQGGAKGYRLLAEAIGQSGRVGIARFVLRQREHLAALRTRAGVLMLSTMRYADEVVEVSETEELPEEVDVKKREREMAEQLIESMTTDFDPERYRDQYRERVRELIRERAEGEEEVVVVESGDGDPGGQVIDLMEALKQSLDQQSGSKRAASKKASGGKKAGSGGKKGSSKKKSSKKGSGKNGSGKKGSGRGGSKKSA